MTQKEARDTVAIFLRYIENQEGTIYDTPEAQALIEALQEAIPCILIEPQSPLVQALVSFYSGMKRQREISVWSRFERSQEPQEAPERPRERLQVVARRKANADHHHSDNQRRNR